jgi:uncharacterized protein
MRILVISDTHIPIVAKELPDVIENEAKRCDCCLHAGDFISYEVYEKLSGWTKTYGVQGNMDDVSVQKKLPEKQVLELEGVRIGLIHGRGTPSGLIDYIDREFSREKVLPDIIVFGHSHCALDKEIDGKFYFNPGSATDTIFASARTYGILEVSGGKIVTRRIVTIG